MRSIVPCSSAELPVIALRIERVTSWGNLTVCPPEVIACIIPVRLALAELVNDMEFSTYLICRQDCTGDRCEPRDRRSRFFWDSRGKACHDFLAARKGGETR